MGATILMSQAGTPKLYVSGQARWREGCLHMQFVGMKGNRSYGYAADVAKPAASVPPATVSSLSSQAGTGRSYFPIQARPVRSSGEVNVQIKDGTGNRGYGSAFRITDAVLQTWLEGQIRESFVAPALKAFEAATA